MKICITCSKDSEEVEFPGRGNKCRPCLAKYQREYRQNNPERVRLAKKAKYARTQEEVKAKARANYWANRESRTEQKREYRKANPEKARASWRRSDARKRQRGLSPEQRLARALRRRIWEALSGKKKAGSAVRDLGCSTTELKRHLEGQFQSGMSWENYGTLWSVDHILPLSAFDLTDRGQFLKASHYTNLQPLTIEENSAKRDRF